MMRRRDLTGFAALAATSSLATHALAQGAEERLMLDLKDGSVTIQFLPDVAPRHVERIKLLVRRGFYDGTPFHRVMEGFMAQGGDQTGTGMGGKDQTNLPDLPAEFTNKYHFIRGTCGMARSTPPDSANSQFFIMLAANAGLDGKYTIWGKVVAGMDAVDRIKRGDLSRNGAVNGPDKLVRARIVNA